MMWIWIAAYVAQGAFNLWAMTRAWKYDFGKVTRGEFLVHAFFAVIPVCGFVIALTCLATPKWKNGWSNFWNKPVL